MKKFTLFALLALAVTAFCACGQIEDEDTSIPTLADPVHKGDAIKLDIPEKDSNGNVNALAADYKYIELTESGEFYLLKRGGDEVVSGEYENAGNDNGTVKYKFKNLGNINLEPMTKASGDIWRIILETGGKTISGFGSEMKRLEESEIVKALCRSWTIVETDVNITSGSTSVEKTYPGGDLYAIASDLSKQGISIDASKLQGCSIKSISFTSGTTLAVNFNGTTYYGTFNGLSMSGKNSHNFSYSFAGKQMGNPLFNANGSGVINWRKGKGVLTINVSSSSFSGSVTFNISQR